MAFMDLFKPRFKHSNSRVREEAVKRLKDQNLLKHIAKNDEISYVREVAVEKLKDQKLLLDIAKKDENYWVRLKAWKQLAGPKTLNGIDSLSRSTRGAAVEELDPEKWLDLLIDIAKNDKEGGIFPDYTVREAAEKKLKKFIEILEDQKQIANFAKNGEPKSVRRTAVLKLEDQ